MIIIRLKSGFELPVTCEKFAFSRSNITGEITNYTIEGIKDNKPLFFRAEDIECIWQKIDTWIPCSERLPEYEEYVLATFADKSTIDTKVLSVRRIETFDGWCWSDFADEYTWEKDEIIAWMPLPEPYKGDEEK